MSDGPAVTSTLGRPPALLLGFVFLVAFSVYLVSPVVYYGDGRLAGPTAASIVQRGDLDVDEFRDLDFVGGYQTVDVDGHQYDFYPWTRSLAALPVAVTLLIGDKLGVTPGPDEAVRSSTWEPALLMVPGALTTAGAVVASTWLAWWQVRDPRRRRRVALLVGVGLAFATGYWSTASRGMWQHGPACLWMSLALVGAWPISQGDRRARWGVLLGATAMAAALTRPTFVIFLVGFGVWILVSHRHQVAAVAAGAATVAVPVVLVNLATFGSLVMPYYDSGRAGGDRPDGLLQGLLASVASPSRGVMVFMPGLVVMAIIGLRAAYRDGREVRMRLMLATTCVAVFLFTAMSAEGWWAGQSFGARFAVDLIPPLAFLAVPCLDVLAFSSIRRPATAAIAALVLWSAFVHAQGALIRQTSCWNVSPVDIDVSRSQVWELAHAQSVVGVEWIARGNSPLDTDCAG
jgi:hypothetical protein